MFLISDISVCMILDCCLIRPSSVMTISICLERLVQLEHVEVECVAAAVGVGG